MEEVGDDRKPVLWFDQAEKGLVLNKTNSDELFTLYGTYDTDVMKGQNIILFTVATKMPSGAPTRGIRLRGIPTQAQAAAALGGAAISPAAPYSGPPTPAQAQDLDQQVIDDEIPF